MKNSPDEDLKMKTSFSSDLEALGALPVPKAFELALELTGRWESPPPRERHLGRRR